MRFPTAIKQRPSTCCIVGNELNDDFCASSDAPILPSAAAHLPFEGSDAAGANGATSLEISLPPGQCALVKHACQPLLSRHSQAVSSVDLCATPWTAFLGHVLHEWPPLRAVQPLHSSNMTRQALAPAAAPACNRPPKLVIPRGADCRAAALHSRGNKPVSIAGALPSRGCRETGGELMDMILQRPVYYAATHALCSTSYPLEPEG